MLGTKPLPLFAASLLTYPLALSYVAVLILIDFFPLRRFGQGFFVPAARRVWLEKVPFVLVFGLVFAATLWARGHGSWQWERPVNLEQFGLLSRVMQAFYIWAYYLWKPLLPFDLSPVYTTLGEFDPLSLRFVLSLALVVASTLILFWKRRQWPGLFALWLCHLAVLVPFLGLTEYPHHPNDRYSYLVNITGSVLVAACLLKSWRDRSLRLKALAGAGMAAALLALLSFVQVGAWKNSEALFRHMIRKLGNDPYRSDIYWRLGMVLSSEGRMAEAEFISRSRCCWHRAPPRRA